MDEQCVVCSGACGQRDVFGRCWWRNNVLCVEKSMSGVCGWSNDVLCVAEYVGGVMVCCV